MSFYCFNESNCKFETMTKEEILEAIAQAAEGGLAFDSEAAFITKVKESNAGGFVTFWVGTQAQYNALQSIDNNCQYIITDKEAGTLEYDTESVTLAAGSWYNKQQVVNVSGVKASNLVIVSPNPAAANFAAYAESNVRCTAQEKGKLTFTCEDVPSIALVVNVAVFT